MFNSSGFGIIILGEQWINLPVFSLAYAAIGRFLLERSRFLRLDNR